MRRSPSNPSRKKFAQPATNGNGMMSKGSANFAATIKPIQTTWIGLVPSATMALSMGVTLRPR